MSVIPNESDMDGDGIEDYVDPIDDRYLEEPEVPDATPESPLENEPEANNGGGALSLYLVLLLFGLMALGRVKLIRS